MRKYATYTSMYLLKNKELFPHGCQHKLQDRTIVTTLTKQLLELKCVPWFCVSSDHVGFLCRMYMCVCNCICFKTQMYLHIGVV